MVLICGVYSSDNDAVPAQHIYDAVDPHEFPTEPGVLNRSYFSVIRRYDFVLSVSKTFLKLPHGFFGRGTWVREHW